MVADLERWMREQRAKLSRGNEVAKAMEYVLKRWTAFTHFLDDGRICLSNNAAELALRGIALGRKPWLFGGSDRGGQRSIRDDAFTVSDDSDVIVSLDFEDIGFECICLSAA